LLELDSLATRQELYRDITALSRTEAGQGAGQQVLFPISVNGQLIAAPGLDARADLIATPDAGAAASLVFDGRGRDRWPDDRRDSLQGLSEREAAELIARGLLAHWGIRSDEPVRVTRAANVSYAAAYVDGVLRINPAFVYLALSATAQP
jgi:hypothetical protein